MASSILVNAEDKLEEATNFNVWKLWITNIFQEHDLEQYVTTVVEEPMNNVGRMAFRRSQENSKRIIFDSVKDIIMPANDFVNNFQGLYGHLGESV
jgi:hypothetical protein